MATLLVAIGFLAIFFAFMSVRLIFLKKGEFKGTCASQNPFLNKDGEACGFCGKMPGSCENDEEGPQNEVDKVMGQFK